jgi:hypothetical protein
MLSMGVTAKMLTVQKKSVTSFKPVRYIINIGFDSIPHKFLPQAAFAKGKFLHVTFQKRLGSSFQGLTTLVTVLKHIKYKTIMKQRGAYSSGRLVLEAFFSIKQVCIASPI